MKVTGRSNHFSVKCFFGLDEELDRETNIWDLAILQGQEKVLKSKYQGDHEQIYKSENF